MCNPSAPGSAIGLLTRTDKIFDVHCSEGGNGNAPLLQSQADLLAARGDHARAGALYRRALDELATAPANAVERIGMGYRGGRALALSGARAEGWPLARDAADMLTGQLVDRSRSIGAVAMASFDESNVFDATVDVAWARGTNLPR